MNENRYLYLAGFKMRRQVCDKYKNSFRTRRMLKVSKFKSGQNALRVYNDFINTLLVTNLVLFANDRFIVFRHLEIIT